MKLKQSEEVERLRHEFEERVREIERRYSNRFSALRSELQLRLKSEVKLQFFRFAQKFRSIF